MHRCKRLTKSLLLLGYLQLMSNPNLMRMASESMKNMKPEDLRRVAEQLNQTRPEDMRDMTEKIANTTPEEFAAMKAQADAQMSYAMSGAKMLKKQVSEKMCISFCFCYLFVMISKLIHCDESP